MPVTEPLIIRASATVKLPSMRSGISQQHVTCYDRHRGTTHNWYVGQVPNAADYIYCRSHVATGRSDGFGGSHIRFPLEGGSVEVQGPWHSNAHALLRDTGIDIRDKHYTRGVIGLKPSDKNYSAEQVIYLDDDWVLGTYSRVEDIAQELSNKYGVTLYGWLASTGGGHSFTVTPKA